MAGLGGNVSQGAARGWVSEAWRGRWWVGGYVEHIVIVFILSLLLTRRLQLRDNSWKHLDLHIAEAAKHIFTSIGYAVNLHSLYINI